MLVHNKGKYVRHRGTVRVLPGVNDIKEKDWNHFKSHPLNAELVKSGEIFELGGESDSEKSEQDYVKITDLNADEAIDMVADTFIDDAKLEMEKHKVPDKYHEKLQRYLAAHFATLDYRRPETQKIGDLQTSYKSPGEESKSNGLEGTEYGKEYNRLLKIALGSKGINLVVF